MSKMNDKFTKEITKDELLKAFKLVPSCKAPKEDGLPTEFFTTL